jgi:CheY-like chemotaxis protein
MESNPGFVLLVEDDPAEAKLIERAFVKIAGGVPLLRLRDGDMAVQYLAGEPPYEKRTQHPLPSLVLLDIKLPRRSGFEVLEWIRQRPDPLRRVPVVMMTSSKHDVDINRAYDLHANSYLVKPDKPKELERIVNCLDSYWLECNQPPGLNGRPPAFVMGS